MLWATTATSATDALDRREPGANVIWDYIDRQYARLQQELGLERWERPDNSPDLVLVFSTRALFGEVPLPASYRFVGPAIGPRPEVEFPWDELRDGPRVLVSLGTVNPDRGRGFFAKVVEGLGQRAGAGPGAMPYQVILMAPKELLPAPIPEGLLVRSYVPQLKLLPLVDAVVCHAGQNTVSEALAQGVPLVMTPIRDDQPMVARMVQAAGAGIRLGFGKRLTAHKLRQAVDRLLSEPSFRAAARELQASFKDAGGAPRAAALLDHLLRHGRVPSEHPGETI